jgi:hypothetical protein
VRDGLGTLRRSEAALLSTTERGSGTAMPRQGPDLPTGLFERQGLGKGRMHGKMPDQFLSGSSSTHRRVQPLHPRLHIFDGVEEGSLRPHGADPALTYASGEIRVPAGEERRGQVQIPRLAALARDDTGSLRSFGMTDPRCTRSGSALAGDDNTASESSCLPRPFLNPSFPHSGYFAGALSSAVGPYIEGTFWSVRRR